MGASREDKGAMALFLTGFKFAEGLARYLCGTGNFKLHGLRCGFGNPDML